MTLTRRLSLYSVATLAAVLVAFSAALYALADRHLTRQLDDQLGAAARTLASASEVEPDGVEWEPGNRPLALAPGAFGEDLRWRVTTDAGHEVARSPQPDAGDLLAGADDALRAGHRNPRRFDHGDRAWQVARVRLAPDPAPTGPVPRGKYPALVLTVAAPLDPVRATLGSLAVALVALTGLVLAIALVAARTVCRRVLAPVARMAGPPARWARPTRPSGSPPPTPTTNSPTWGGRSTDCSTASARLSNGSGGSPARRPTSSARPSRP